MYMYSPLPPFWIQSFEVLTKDLKTKIVWSQTKHSKIVFKNIHIGLGCGRNTTQYISGCLNGALNNLLKTKCMVL